MKLLCVLAAVPFICFNFAAGWKVGGCTRSDPAVCEEALKSVNKNQCYLQSTNTLCCNWCESHANLTRASTCPWGDRTDAVSISTGQVTCAIINESCDYCTGQGHLGIDNCCQTCEDVCGVRENKNMRLLRILRILNAAIDDGRI